MKFDCENCGTVTECLTGAGDVLTEMDPTGDISGQCVECMGAVVSIENNQEVVYFPEEEMDYKDGRTSTGAFEVIAEGGTSRRQEIADEVEAIQEKNKEIMAERTAVAAQQQTAIKEREVATYPVLGKGDVMRIKGTYSLSLHEFTKEEFTLAELANVIHQYVGEEEFRIAGLRDMISLDMYPRMRKMSHWKLLRQGFTGADHMKPEEHEHFIATYLQYRARQDELMEGLEKILSYICGYVDMKAELEAIENDTASGADKARDEVDKALQSVLCGDVIDLHESGIEERLTRAYDLLTGKLED